MSETWYENRPCPSDECGGQIRRFKIMTMTTGSGKVIARVQRCSWCGYEPRTVQGSAHLEVTADISSAGEVIPTPESVENQTADLEEIGYRVTWYRLEGGLFFVQVHDDAGKLLDLGGGDDPVEMILEVAEHLLPPQ